MACGVHRDIRPTSGLLGFFPVEGFLVEFHHLGRDASAREARTSEMTRTLTHPRICPPVTQDVDHGPCDRRRLRLDDATGDPKFVLRDIAIGGHDYRSTTGQRLKQ